MAIDRITGTTGTSSVSEWVSLASQPSGATMYEFTATGNEGTYTTAGARYRVLQYRTAGSYAVTFDRPGRIEIFLVAGGGSAGGWNQDNVGGTWTGGGGGGGLIQNYGLSLSNVSQTVVVGAGAVNPSTGNGSNGGLSSFNQIIAIGGGSGAGGSSGTVGGAGGSGGGAHANNNTPGSGTIGQGNNGSLSGGGGAGTAAASHRGGQGLLLNFDGTFVRYAAGGNSGGDLYTAEGQTQAGGNGFGTNANGGSPGAGGGGALYPGSTTDASGGAGDRGVVFLRWRVS